MGLFKFMKKSSQRAQKQEPKKAEDEKSNSSASVPEDEIDAPWWKGAIIYQVYPRSFCDVNGDGIGDLKGITRHMDYIASLNVDAIWVSPFMKSPMKDFGYDVSDYRDVDPTFGTLEDFDEMLEAAHEHDIKIIIDQVLSHTSDEHAWFVESREDKTNDKADFYVWADPRDDGCPPNNWLSIFGGSAWQFDSRREQYYLHNFLTSQPDLNFHNPRVQQEVLDNVEFWLKRGVDGFRLDAINFCFHDQKLRDNPPKPIEVRDGKGFSTDNPYAYQYHYYNNTRPEMIPFLQKLRALLDKYPGTMSLGEVSSEDSLGTMAEYTSDFNKLHTAYSFELLTKDSSAEYIKKTVSEFHRRVKDGFPCWAIGNHDVERVVTRWGDELKGDAELLERFPSLLTAMLVSLRGSVCIYQGEELGLEEAEVTFEQLQDPYGKAFWPKFKGRDGCRTPLPWAHEEENAGFSQGEPWLPVYQSHQEKAVDVQDVQDDSTLNRFRDLLAWRRTKNTLLVGRIEFLDSSPQVLAFTRSLADETLLCVFNLGTQATHFKHALLSANQVVPEPVLPNVLCAEMDGDILDMPPISGIIARVQ